MMHIAAALKKKVISVWGSTVPAFGMYPYYPPGEENYYIIENNDLICRPCSKLGYKKCPEKHFKCMNDIDLNKIFSLLD
jgi:heptosyltransferase-2